MKTISSLISLVLVSIFPLGSVAQDYEVPRTEWGQPDLQGVWNFRRMCRCSGQAASVIGNFSLGKR